MDIIILLIAMTMLVCAFILFGIRVFLQFLESRGIQVENQIEYPMEYEDVWRCMKMYEDNIGLVSMTTRTINDMFIWLTKNNF